jgi:hypothetical protein
MKVIRHSTPLLDIIYEMNGSEWQRKAERKIAEIEKE